MDTLTFTMLNKLICHAHFYFSANQITLSRLLIQIQIFNDSADPDQELNNLALQMDVCKGRAYQGSARLGLTSYILVLLQLNFNDSKIDDSFTRTVYCG